MTNGVIFSFFFSSISGDQLFPSLHRWDETGMTVLSPPWLPHPSSPSLLLRLLLLSHFPFAHHHPCKPGEKPEVLLCVSGPLKHKWDTYFLQKLDKKEAGCREAFAPCSCCLGSQTRRLTKTTGLKSPPQAHDAPNLTDRSTNLRGAQKKKIKKRKKKKPKVGKMLRMTPSFQLRRATDRLARFGKERKKQKNNNNQNKRKPET